MADVPDRANKAAVVAEITTGDMEHPILALVSPLVCGPAIYGH